MGSTQIVVTNSRHMSDAYDVHMEIGLIFHISRICDCKDKVAHLSNYVVYSQACSIALAVG